MISQFETSKDVSNVIVRSGFAGGKVKVEDIGTVKEGFEDEKMRTIFDGKRGISLIIKKSSNEDIIRVVDSVKDYLQEKQKHIPQEIKMSAVNDKSYVVRNRLNVVQSNAIIGFVLVFIVLIIFLDFSSSFLIALSIPTSFAITFICLPLTNMDINAISLAAMIIALGMIVDQPIVVSENAIVYVSKGEKKSNTILHGTLEVVSPVFASVLTTVLSFAPMFVMTGTMGKFIVDIRNMQGKLVPIKAFAKLSKTRAETSIHHTDGDVTTTITAQTTLTVQPKEVIDNLLAKFSKELINYPNVSFSYGGEAEETQESVRSLLFAFLGGILAIYLILIILFNSVSQPMIVLLAIPFGLIGVIWAFYFHDRPFSFIGLVGVIGLSGIVVNNSLMMVEFINKLVTNKAKQGSFKAVELIPDIVAGASRRLRPIVITTITTVIGLLPTAYGIGGSDPFIEPMVLAIAWGLLVSTQISLVLIPSFYMANLDIHFAFRGFVTLIKDKIIRYKKG